MIARCGNPKESSFINYGGRGIKVCDKWRLSFIDFMNDMPGYADGLEIDRINTNGNYEPGNCLWVTNKENTRNRRNTRYCYVDGITKPIGEWADEFGIQSRVIRDRIASGWSTETAVRTPVRKKVAMSDNYKRPSYLTPPEYNEDRFDDDDRSGGFGHHDRDDDGPDLFDDEDDGLDLDDYGLRFNPHGDDDDFESLDDEPLDYDSGPHEEDFEDDDDDLESEG
jgi:hypothetical protein